MAVAVTLAWLSFVVIGYQLIGGVVSQHVEGYPNPGQLQLYLVVPSVFTFFAALSGISFWIGCLRGVARVVQVVAAVALFPYFMLLGGGV